MSRPAVFLDRDGVLNRAFVRGGKPYPPQTLDEFEILDGVPEALRELKAAGFVLVVATNQPDVTKGLQRREVVDAMHARLREVLPIDALKVCWCLERPDCDCYKPRPGLLLEAARELDLDLARSFMVGDRWRDIGAGRAAGCHTILIDRNYAETLVDQPDFTCREVPEAVRVILAQPRRSH